MRIGEVNLPQTVGQEETGIAFANHAGRADEVWCVHPADDQRASGHRAGHTLVFLGHDCLVFSGVEPTPIHAARFQHADLAFCRRGIDRIDADTRLDSRDDVLERLDLLLQLGVARFEALHAREQLLQHGAVGCRQGRHGQPRRDERGGQFGEAHDQ